MGAPKTEIEAAEQPAAESLLDAFKTISAAERRKHASVLNYWLSIRGDKEFPPLHDLDPLELTDAGPNSILLELISGGHDAEVRHLGEAVRFEGKVDRIIDAPTPSLLASIAKKLPIVAISRDFLAFEDEYETAEGKTHCWVTQLPLSAGGAWVDYVYALATFDSDAAKASKTKAKEKESEAEPETETAEDAVIEVQEPEPEVAGESVPEEEPVEAIAPEVEEPVDEAPADTNDEPLETAAEQAPESAARGKPGFSKLLDNLAGLTGFYGHGYTVEPGVPSDLPVQEGPVEEERAAEPPVAEPVAEEPEPVAEPEPTAEPEPVSYEPEEVVEEPPQAEVVDEPAAEVSPAAEEPSVAEEPLELTAPPTTLDIEDAAPVASEGPLKSKLADVRAKADEARAAKLRANAALYDGLSAAYDFALDAEQAPEEYLRLVEAEGLKIQLRSPMKPVVKLAFDGMCDDSTIKQLEAILAWAFDQELPRGTLAERIESEGGIAPILSRAA